MLVVDLWEARALGGVSRALVVVVLMLVPIVAGVSASVATAEACPNEQVRRQETYAFHLSDCRAYEQVSPTAKNLTDVSGDPGVVQAAPSGDGISFFAVSPLPGASGSAGDAPTYLSLRSPENEWLTEGLLPMADPGSADQVLALTESLGEVILAAEEPPLAPGAAIGAPNIYAFDAATGASQLVARGLGPEGFGFAGAATDGSRILFETQEQLTANAAPSVYNLYEWDAAKPPGKQIALAGVLQDGKAPESGSVAGPGGLAILPKARGGSAGEFYTEDAISEDGARIFFTEASTTGKGVSALGKGVVYMREPEADQTVQVSAGAQPAYWRAATPNGSFALYTEGGNLYRFDAESGQREALTDGSANVLGALGISGDGSYVYFVATAELASNRNGSGERAKVGAANLYEWHMDVATGSTTTMFIAQLQGTNSGEVGDESDWRGYSEVVSEGNGPSGGEKSSRVTPNGKAVLFTSTEKLTDYNNNGQIELYLYDAEEPLSSQNPLCVSCNPDGMPAVSGARLEEANSALAAVPFPRNASLTRNLSENGDRVFFQTAESLVPEDTNGQTDVYEWERPGTGSCESTSPSFSPLNGGCIYLISTGQSNEPSYFGDASADGNDVFFFTRQSLVGQDQDLNVDLYDARVDGGIPAQNPPPAPEPCTGEACREPPPTAPVFAPPASTSITGTGNVVQAAAAQTTVASKQPTRAQRLAKALHACRKPVKKLTGKERRACEAQARIRYGAVSKRSIDDRKRESGDGKPSLGSVSRRGP
jgi:hypothetical protein